MSFLDRKNGPGFQETNARISGCHCHCPLGPGTEINTPEMVVGARVYMSGHQTQSHTNMECMTLSLVPPDTESYKHGMNHIIRIRVEKIFKLNVISSVFDISNIVLKFNPVMKVCIELFLIAFFPVLIKHEGKCGRLGGQHLMNSWEPRPVQPDTERFVE